MWVADKWQEYTVLDTGNGSKLEDWGGYKLVRPDPQVLWDKDNEREWQNVNAVYHRSDRGGGEWEFIDLPKCWDIHYKLGNESLMTFHLKPFNFKHTGVFPEQAVNWEFSYELIKEEIRRRKDIGDIRPLKVLNLFAYTGGASIAAASAGAKVTHVDASKGMVAWAKENALSSKVPTDSIRYLVDDCVKFIEREIRRGNSYDAIIMDPPSYGRGPKGETWKIEKDIYPFIKLAMKVLCDKPLFMLINSYTTGLQAGVLSYMLDKTMVKKYFGRVSADEIGLPVGKRVLPEGASARWQRA